MRFERRKTRMGGRQTGSKRPYSGPKGATAGRRNGRKAQRPEAATARNRNGQKPQRPETATARNRNGRKPQRRTARTGANGVSGVSVGQVFASDASIRQIVTSRLCKRQYVRSTRRLDA